MDWEDRLHGFHLDHYVLSDQEIDAISTVDSHAAVPDRHWDLAKKGNAPLRQFMSKAGLVDRLEKARAKLSVNRYRRAENRLRQAI